MLVNYLFLFVIQLNILSIKGDDGCSISPCRNGGTCVSQSNLYGFTCSCTKEWTGTICDKSKSETNNIISGSGYKQTNNAGGSIYVGQNSNNLPTSGGNINIFDNKQPVNGNSNPCSNNPCLNGGLCSHNFFKSSSAFVCKCYGNFYGDRCQFQGRRRNFLISSVIPIFIVISLIGLSIYCCCYRKRLAQNANNMNVNGNRASQGLVGQIISFPTTIFQSRQPKPSVQYTAAPNTRPPYPTQSNVVIIQQDPEIAFRVNTNNPPPPPYSSLYTSEQKPLNN